MVGGWFEVKLPVCLKNTIYFSMLIVGERGENMGSKRNWEETGKKEVCAK